MSSRYPQRKHRSPVGDDGHQPGRPIPPPLPDEPDPPRREEDGSEQDDA
ncbi:hypothetical protein [Streptomyces zhaozhouensis]|nr:hypothetical protein [Streptomyces zhaozhouensis]